MLDPLGVAGIAAADDLVDEAAIGGEIMQVGSAVQQQRIGDRPLGMAMRTLVRIAIEIAEGGRQAVGLMLPRCPAERPQGILQPFGQSDEALATEHDMGVIKPQ